MKYLTMAVIGIIALLSAVDVNAQSVQQTSALSITSPATGTVVSPGATIVVSVTVTSGTYPKGIAIIGGETGGPGVTAGPASGPSPSFSITVPADCDSGPFTLSANAIDSSGNFDSSFPVVLDVERSEVPVSLRVDPVSFDIQVGQSLPVTVFGVYADGSWHGLTQSSRLQLASSNTAVATVQNGFVIGSGAGSTSIQISYGSLTTSASVVVTSSNSCYPATKCKP